MKSLSRVINQAVKILSLDVVLREHVLGRYGPFNVKKGDAILRKDVDRVRHYLKSVVL